MKPLLMMRARGLSGPAFAKHAGIRGLSRSAGNFIGSSHILRPLLGWTGDVGCTSQSDTLVNIRFIGKVTYTDHTGVTITHDNGGTFTVTGPAAATACRCCLPRG